MSLRSIRYGMPLKKYHIKLEEDERAELKRMAGSQKASVSKVQRAKALLAMDISANGEALSDSKSSQRSGLSVRSLERLRKRVIEVGALGALERVPRLTPPVEPKVTGEVEAHMIRLACSQPPEGYARWTYKLIAERLVELEIVDSITGQTVRTTLKKTNSSLGNRKAGASRRKKTPPS